MSGNAEEGEEEKKPKYENINQTEEEMIDWAFGIFDKHGEDRIEFIDLGTLLRWLQFNPTEEELRDYAEEYDKERKGLNKDKVKAIFNRKKCDPDTQEQLVEAMKLFDNDKDGKLLVPELRWAMLKLGDTMDEGMCDEMLKSLDTDGSGMIDIKLYSDTCFNVKAPKAEPTAVKAPAKKK
jgi:Ca2+-binding EF-hand superfamily protein